MPNIITIPAKKRVRIQRNGRGAIVRIDNECADIMEEILEKAGDGLTVQALASSLIKYAAKDTIVKIEDREEIVYE